MNLPLIALAIAAFGIGTTEFVIMGLLPQVATDLSVSIPEAGLLVTGYALGVAIGAPIMGFLTARLPHKSALLLLMGIFIGGNMLCALAPHYTVLMAARVITALCHGAFFGIGSVTAASVVAENRKASAVSMMFSGLTLANVLGVPMGTALGQALGWRSTFWAVAAIGAIAFGALATLLPADQNAQAPDLRRESHALRSPAVWIALAMTILFSGSMFTLFTYIAPLLGEITHVSPSGVTYTLVSIGIGLTIGNLIGGRFADMALMPTLAATAAAVMLLQFVFYWTSVSVVSAEITLFFWGAASFAGCSALQFNAMTTGKDAPSLIATLNIGAFNVGNALGAYLGGVVIEEGAGLRAISFAGSALALCALGTLGVSLVWRRYHS